MKVTVFNVAILIAGCVAAASAGCQKLGSKCKSGTFRRDPDDCNLFCHCAHRRWYQKRCPRGLYFDETHMVCNYPDNVPACEPLVGLCAERPCANGGTCVETGNGYLCNCRPGFGGMNCNTADTDPCMENPCQNGARCRPATATTVTCDCPPGYSGGFCQFQDVTCQRYTCPRNVTSYNYPDWQDPTCSAYFQCRLGNLQRQTCPRNTVFSFMLLRCVNPSELEFPCTLNFVDSVVQ